jgi:PAS domain-containing protein
MIDSIPRDGETNAELHEAFAKVGTVLWDAPVPYALLDANDQVKDCNRAMCELLGFGEKQELLGGSFDLSCGRKIRWPMTTFRTKGGGISRSNPILFGFALSMESRFRDGL